MYQFFESINIVNGIPQNLKYHQDRLNGTVHENFNCESGIILHKLLIVPERFKKGVTKSKISYDLTGYDLCFEQYVPKTINTLKIVQNDSIDYSYKYADRSLINNLMLGRENCDDILIVKNNCITDISFANIAFYDGKEWYTPDTPLLEGTCRTRLLNSGTIINNRIKLADLKSFSHFAIINAMRGDDLTDIKPISNIY